MKSKDQIIADYIRDYFVNTDTVGIIFKGIDDINPAKIVTELVSFNHDAYYYVASVGYDDNTDDNTYDEECHQGFELVKNIEKAVLWRSKPDCAGKIIVFIKEDTDKLHSLAEFSMTSTRDISQFLISQQISNENNIPTNKFWEALERTSGYYTFDAVYDFVAAVNDSGNPVEAIPQNMWRLNLLRDADVLSAKNDPEDRLKRNRDRIFEIGQLSEDARKKLSNSLVRSKDSKKEQLQDAYNKLQSFYKYGDIRTLKELDFDIIEELFSASQKRSKVDKTSGDSDNSTGDKETSIAPKDVDKKISTSIVAGNDDAMNDIRELYDELVKHFSSDDESDDGEDISPIGGIFENKKIILNVPKSNLRKIVGRFCNSKTWGGILKTEESVLKDAISNDTYDSVFFEPDNAMSWISYGEGVDGGQSLFNFMGQFDNLFDSKGSAEPFIPIIDKLRESRSKLLNNLDMIMYYPVLFFGANSANCQLLIEYIETWSDLYHAICNNEHEMRRISVGGTNRILKTILLLDILYIETPTELKGVLMPLHPFFLWRYYEVFKSFSSTKDVLSDQDKKALEDVLSQLPQVLNFIVANSLITGSTENRVLPNSGAIEMLPTFENKTNRYLGNDGTDSIEEILTRWVGFAPYTRNEVRICSVDAPDLIKTLRQIKSFMDKNSVIRVVK